jgi:putative ABC transport system permease protein
MKRLWPPVRSVWRVLWRSNRLEAEMREEMRFHIEMETERLMREHGLHPQEARRQAHIRFGGVEKYKEEGRDARGRQWLDAISLDARLGVRMLVKYRGLTLVGGFAMAVAIAVGATFFEAIGEMLDPALPFEDGERVVVSLHYVASNPGNPERRVLHDFVALREELVSVEHLGAFRDAQHNLVSANTPPEPVRVAEITASGFVVSRTPPLLGRYLLPTDERKGAPPVVVIGHQAWQSRLGGDFQILGRMITLGGVPRTVVGVMPDGFRFPVDHQFWIPLRENPLNYERLQGPQLYLFGRLARGITLEQAQAELTAVGQRAPVVHPATGERLRPVVLPYTREHVDLSHPDLVSALRLAQLLIGALSLVVAVNLAILVYARTVTRLGEIAVRTALGASRRRILAQLFIEALALSIVGAGTGLVLAHLALGSVQSLAHASGSVPFWLDFELSAGTVIYAFGLAVLAAVIIGVLPGFKATARDVTANLHEFHGRTGARLGPTWTALVVVQVAVAVAVLPAAVYIAWQLVRMEVAGPGFAADEFVVSTMVLSEDPSGAGSNRVSGRQLELMSRLEAEPGVTAVTFSSNVPGFAGSRQIQFEDGVQVRAAGTLWPSTLDVDPGMFDTYGVEILAGRAFDSGDLGAAHAAIVNRTFAEEFLGTRSALGLRFRYSRAPVQEPGSEVQQEWHQIVGVVRDFPSFSPAPGSDGEPTVYHPAAPGDVHPVVISVRFNGGIPAGATERFRQIGAEVDPALQLRRVVPLSEFYRQVRSLWRYLAWGIGLVTTSVLLLSAAGIYALVSFTVAQRTREIGIRTALGAPPRRLLLDIFGRAMRQLAFGSIVGTLLSAAVFSVSGIGFGRASALLLAVGAIMLAVGLLAALGPARRSLRIPATEALRADL